MQHRKVASTSSAEVHKVLACAIFVRKAVVAETSEQKIRLEENLQAELGPGWTLYSACQYLASARALAAIEAVGDQALAAGLAYADLAQARQSALEYVSSSTQ